jgi:hypothetical protein
MGLKITMNELAMQKGGRYAPVMFHLLMISHSFDLRRSDFVISFHLYVRGRTLRCSPVSAKIRTQLST